MIKRNIDINLIRSIKVDGDILSIHNDTFYLHDISQYSDQEINDLYSEQNETLNNLISKKDYKEYLNRVPSYSQVFLFYRHTFDKNNTNKDFWKISDKDYWELVRFLWLSNSNIYNDRYSWKYILRSNRGNKKYIMTDDEKYIFKQLPRYVLLYRGYVKTRGEYSRNLYLNNKELSPVSGLVDDVIVEKKNKNIQDLKKYIKDKTPGVGFSYTLSEEIGNKYKDRYTENISNLFKQKVNKKNLLGLINERNEEEIIIIPRENDYYCESLY